MPESMFYLIGGILIGMLVFTIGYRLITISIIQSQKQMALTDFNELASDLDIVCLQEVNNSMLVKLKIPNLVRVIYATDNTTDLLPTVIDSIKHEELSEGQNLCLQFKNEQFIRCEGLICNSSIPYMGALETYNDFQLMVKKILGEALVKDHTLLLTKVETEVNTTMIE